MRIRKIMKSSDNVKRKQYLRSLYRHRELYLFMLPALVILFIFSYIPMYGVFMAFQDVKIGNPIFGNEWVGLRHFTRFFNSGWFGTVMKNTIAICFLNNILCWPVPIVLALLLHNSSNRIIKKITQTVTYIPHLISIVVTVSIINVLCSGESGLINILLAKMGHERINFFGDPGWVWPLYIISGLWQNAGYSAIVYLAALTSVSNELEEAAQIDGAGKIKRIWHVQLPTILPSVVTMLILDLGKAFAMTADKMLLLQTDLNLTTSEIISTYVYKSGFLSSQYGFSTAVGIFQSVVNLIMLLTVNKIAKKMTGTSVI